MPFMHHIGTVENIAGRLTRNAASQRRIRFPRTAQPELER